MINSSIITYTLLKAWVYRQSEPDADPQNLGATNKGADVDKLWWYKGSNLQITTGGLYQIQKGKVQGSSEY